MRRDHDAATFAPKSQDERARFVRALGIEPGGRLVEKHDRRIVQQGARQRDALLQTFRQLLPWSIEYQAARPRPIAAPLAKIHDRPRFAWRGAMLDVARHFFGVDDVKRYIDYVLGKTKADGAAPIFILYNVPGRDCGQHSKGGLKTGEEYRRWIRKVAKASN